jgi:hypothetical protein
MLGAYQQGFWCAPFVALVRTKIAGDAHQNSQDSATNPANVQEKAKSSPFPQVILNYRGDLPDAMRFGGI